MEAGFNPVSGKSSRVLYFPGDTRSTKDNGLFPVTLCAKKFIASMEKYLHYFLLIYRNSNWCSTPQIPMLSGLLLSDSVKL